MEHKLFTIVLLAILLSDTTNGRTKDPDEDRAYEFGFTIEGMQHRHEKKDVNGIIQGEFGFITADGVYHVTVYATDENGNFRILSMKNIKVSPPLDGSPDYGSSKYSSIPKAPQSPQSPSLQPVQVQKRTDVSTTKAPNRAFTTQPTVKPACAGCGYVTTTKRPPSSNGQPGGYQGGLLSGQPPSGVSSLSSTSGQPPIGVSSFVSINGPSPIGGSTFSSTNGQGGVGVGFPGSSSFSRPGLANRYQQNVPVSSEGLVAPGVGTSSQGQKNGNNAGASPYAPQTLNNGIQPSLPGNSNPKIPSSNPSYSDSFGNPPNNQNEVLGGAKPNQHTSQITYRNPDPPVKVSNGVIKVPGNPDVEIKDKYPGMVDGLPAGIEEKDITDILYRFNWTVGFQGHYETGYKNGAKVGGYFVNGSDGISRVVTYVADEFGYRPKVKIVNIGLDSPDTPKDDKTFVLKSFEFVWYPVK